MDVAAKHNLPLLVHSNIGPAWLEKPSYLPELEMALKAHPKTRIIWAHAGISRRIVIPNHTEIVGGMLERNPNLTIDLSAIPPFTSTRAGATGTVQHRRRRTAHPHAMWIIQQIEVLIRPLAPGNFPLAAVSITAWL